jgi:hypothetical protein
VTGLRLELAVVPRPGELRMRDRGGFVLDTVVTNLGDEPVEPQWWLVRLAVDGEDSVRFAFTVANGVRERRPPLAPGESATTSWPGLGRSLLERPGEHTLVLSLGDSVSPPAVVRVRR